MKNTVRAIANKYFGNKKQFLMYATCFLLLASQTFASQAQTIASQAQTIGDVASTVTASFAQLGKLITAGSYLAGLGFSIGAIMKFKQHKDNPTQIPIGTPIALVFIAAALLFLPSILSVSGATLFGSSAQTAGPTGTNITSPGSGG